jgi:hypothetical protein
LKFHCSAWYVPPLDLSLIEHKTINPSHLCSMHVDLLWICGTPSPTD